MSWTRRNPRVPMQPVPGRQDTTATLDEATGEVRRLTRLLAISEARFTEAQHTVKEQAERLLDLNGRIECQADNHERDRAAWEAQLGQARDQIRQLEQANARLLEQNTVLRYSAGLHGTEVRP